jgi:outer membrane lipoprotein-sorting protein
MKKISFLLMLLSSILYAQNGAELYQKLNQRYGTLQSFQAEVSQRNFYSNIEQEITYRGRLYFQPGKMLMSFEQPNVQRLYIYSGLAELYDGASKTLYRNEILPELSKMNPLEILQLYWNKSELQILSQAEGKSRIRLIPRQDPMLEELEAIIESKSGIVSYLSYTDRSENTVSYSFSNIITDRQIPRRVWQFSYPEDTRIIEQ